MATKGDAVIHDHKIRILTALVAMAAAPGVE
jgi:hypothetical protein